MNIKSPVFFLIILLGSWKFSLAQNSATVDSLLRLESSTKVDTARASLYCKIGRAFLHTGNYSKSLVYGFKSLFLAQKHNYSKGIFNAYFYIGNAYYVQSNYVRSLEYSFRNLKFTESIKDTAAQILCLLTTGQVYEALDDSPNAYKFYKKTEQLAAKIKDSLNIAVGLSNISSTQFSLGKYTESIKTDQQALAIFSRLKDTNNVIMVKQHLATKFQTLGKTKIAEAQLLSLINEVKNYDKPMALADIYGALSYLYFESKQLDKAITCQKERMEIHAKRNALFYLIDDYSELADIYFLQLKYPDAIEYYNKAVDLAKETATFDIEYIYDGLAKTYEKMGDLKKALFYQKKLAELSDSIYSSEAQKKLSDMQTNYSIELKEKEIVRLNFEKNALEKEKEFQKFIRNGFVFGFLLVLTIIFVVIRSYRQKQKANLKIQSAYQTIEEKNLQISDSITYALRIQQSVLQPVSLVLKSLPNAFILFKPKDVVSGDFFWFEEKENFIFIAAADCTGHGVPGAFMSMLCYDKLNEALSQTVDVSKILSLVNLGVKKALRQSDQNTSSRDGMDIALCRFDSDLKYVEYAGANRPLWIINKNDNSKIVEIKATKTAIGGHTRDEQEFVRHKVELQKNDSLYLFSDGFADQFNALDKKLMTRKFKEILISIQDKSMEEQKYYLDNFIDKWKSGVEQTDDILVIGVRV